MNKEEHTVVYLECGCSAKDHVVCLTLVDWSKDDEVPKEGDLDLYLNMQMSPDGGFFRRVWTAIRFVFKRTPCHYGYWNETIISPAQAKKLIEVSENYLARVAQLEEVSGSKPEG